MKARIKIVIFAFLLLKVPVAFGEQAASLDSLYMGLLEERKQRKNTSHILEQLFGGLAAFALGTYGSRSAGDSQELSLVYSATQSAGVIVAGNAIKNYYSPDIILEMEDFSKQNFSDEKQRDLNYKKLVVVNDVNKKRASYRYLAYTSGLLGLIYATNAMELRRSNEDISNIYAFLGFNALLVSTVSFYELSALDSFTLGFDMGPESKLKMSWSF